MAVVFNKGLSYPGDAADQFFFDRNGKSLLNTFPFNHRQPAHDHDHDHAHEHQEKHEHHDELLGMNKMSLYLIYIYVFHVVSYLIITGDITIEINELQWALLNWIMDQ